MRRALAALALAASALSAHGAERFSFAAFGDTPYFGFEERAVERLIAGFAGANVAFAVHVGDFKLGVAPCSDELFADRRRLFDASPVPFVFVPGDNEWTDCGGALAGGHDPLERLARLRTLFHAGDESLGRRTIRLARQSADPRFAAYRENVRWEFGGVVFATLNIPGSNNNLRRDGSTDAEHAARMAANLAWLADAARRARADGAAGLVVFAHGDPGFERPPRPLDGYVRFRAALQTHAAQLGKPLLFVHGDGHRYRVDQPLGDPATGRRLARFTRLEVFGAPQVQWVRVDVDPANPRLFAIAPGDASPFAVP